MKKLYQETPYSRDEAADEAEELKKRTESGNAKNYSEAERSLEDEKFVTIQGLFGRYQVNREAMLEIVKKSYAEFLDRGRSENDRSIVLDVYDRTIFNIARDFMGEVDWVKHHDAFGPRNFSKPNLFDEISAAIRKLEKDKESVLAEYRRKRDEEKINNKEQNDARERAIKGGNIIVLRGSEGRPIDVDKDKVKQWLQEKLDLGVSEETILEEDVPDLAISLGQDNFEGVSLIIPVRELVQSVLGELNKK